MNEQEITSLFTFLLAVIFSVIGPFLLESGHYVSGAIAIAWFFILAHMGKEIAKTNDKAD